AQRRVPGIKRGPLRAQQLRIPRLYPVPGPRILLRVPDDIQPREKLPYYLRRRFRLSLLDFRQIRYRADAAAQPRLAPVAPKALPANQQPRKAAAFVSTHAFSLRHAPVQPAQPPRLRWKSF